RLRPPRAAPPYRPGRGGRADLSAPRLLLPPAVGRVPHRAQGAVGAARRARDREPRRGAPRVLSTRVSLRQDPGRAHASLVPDAAPAPFLDPAGPSLV